MLFANKLTDKILKELNTEIDKCTERGIFDPKSFDETIYLQAIYDYIKDNAEITLSYTGSLPTGPDPNSGKLYKFTSKSVSNSMLNKTVISAQRGIISFPPTKWWEALIESIQIEVNLTSDDGIITISPLVLQAESNKIFSARDFEGMNDRKDIWNVISREIISAVNFSTPSSNTINTKSIAGGIGVSTLLTVV